MKNTQVASGSTGCLSILIVGLTLIFVTLKLAEIGTVATWSWWLVLSPLLVYGGCIGIALLVALIGFVVYAIFQR